MLEPQEFPASGIWPRRLTLWLAAVWIALWIIRPWEIMIPELAPLRIPRLYAMGMIGLVVLGGQLRCFANTYQTLAVLLFTAALIISALNGFSPANSWEQLYFAFTIIFFYFILLSVIRTPYELAFVICCYIVVMAFTLAKSELEFLVFGARMTAQGVRRMLGMNLTYHDPNVTAEYAVVSLPFLYYLWKVRNNFTRTWPLLWRRLFPVALVAYFFIALAGTLFTHSRAGVVGFVMCLTLLSVAGKHPLAAAKTLAKVGLLLAAVWLCLPAHYQGRISSLWDADAGDYSAGGVTGEKLIESRMSGMWLGIEMCRRSPATGVGIGNFGNYRAAYIDGVSLVAHSLIGQTVGETGFLGSAAFVLLILVVFFNCRYTRKLCLYNDDPDTNHLGHVAMACQQAILLALLFGFSLHNLLRFHWYWIAAFALLARVFALRLSEMHAAEAAQLEVQNGHAANVACEQFARLRSH